MKTTRHALIFWLFGGFVAFLHAAEPAVPTPQKPNVLFIVVDDLNHWVRHLGRNPGAKTPNLDRLARMGVSFTNAHCAAPECNPSRTAVLSGRRPGQSGVYSNAQEYFRGDGVSNQSALVTQFRNAGYETLGMGKIWHGHAGLGFREQWVVGHAAPEPHGEVEKRGIDGFTPFGILQGGDEALADTGVASFGVSQLQETRQKPFFLALGFHKPHLPWNLPAKYFELHPLDQIQLPPVLEGDLNDVPEAGKKMAKAHGSHAEVLRSGRWKEAIQAYLAAISYVDGQIGRVLDALESSPHRDNTIVCLWGDHGYHLGEKEHWSKFTLWEEATRAPFLWVVPRVTQPGSRCTRAVDFMSIYPTLCALAGIPRPANVEGLNIAPLLANPEAAWDAPAVTTHGPNNHAIRTERWRYIRYADGSEELYDHEQDPYEWTNLAALADKESVKTMLAAWLPKENMPVLPNGKSKPK